MRKELEDIAKVERYLNGELSEEEINEFREEMRLNSALEKEVEKQRLIQEGIQSIYLKQAAVSAYRKFKIIRLAKIIGISLLSIIITITIFLLINSHQIEEPESEPVDHNQIRQPIEIDTISEKNPVPSKSNITELNEDSLASKRLKFTESIDEIIIEAENYTDYKDLSPENVGNVISNDAVDLYNFGSYIVVGHTFPNEWLEYTFDIPVDGEYEILISVGSGQNNVERAIDFTFNNNYWKTVNTPFTSSWLDYETISCGSYQFEKGNQQKLKIDFKTGWINLDKIILRYPQE